MTRNMKTLYEEVDSYETVVERKSKCALCKKELIKGTVVNKVHYSQLGGYLIQHKYLCLEHEIPRLYRAGVGFKLPNNP